jgi:hypothetical protein
LYALASSAPIRTRSFAAEEMDQPDGENDDKHGFEDEGSGLPRNKWSGHLDTSWVIIHAGIALFVTAQ